MHFRYFLAFGREHLSHALDEFLKKFDKMPYRVRSRSQILIDSRVNQSSATLSMNTLFVRMHFNKKT